MHTNVYIHINTHAHQPVARNSESSLPCNASGAVFTRKGCGTVSTVPQRLESRPCMVALKSVHPPMPRTLA